MGKLTEVVGPSGIGKTQKYFPCAFVHHVNSIGIHRFTHPEVPVWLIYVRICVNAFYTVSSSENLRHAKLMDPICSA